MTGSFLHKDPADLERFLVQQARSDRAPRGALQRAVVSLTSASLGLSLTGSAKLAWAAGATGKVTPWLIAKCVTIGMSATLAAFVGAEQLQRAFDAGEASSGGPKPAQPDVVLGQPANVSSVTASVRSTLVAAPPALSTRAAAAAPGTAAVPLEADAPSSSDPSLPSSTAFDAAGGTGSPAALAREVARLRSVRASLAAGAPRAALHALDRYALEFPSGALRAEAAALRIEALALLGDAALMRRLASDFLARFPVSPLVERVRAVSGMVDEGESKP
jgi:hypothetical protein